VVNLSIKDDLKEARESLGLLGYSVKDGYNLTDVEKQKNISEIENPPRGKVPRPPWREDLGLL
jgi:hypothetical protein